MSDITRVVTYAARCSTCGRRGTHRDYATAESWHQVHAAEHRASVEIGRSLAGSVFDTEHPDVPYINQINEAIRAAQAAGFAFIAWNGRVFPASEALNFNRPLCWAVDVPGLTAADRQVAS